MSDALKSKQREVDENYKAFSEMLPELLEKYPGKFVVLRHKKAESFFDTARDAMVHGSSAYSDGLFSVQEITKKSVDLGWFSHALLQTSF
jgi:hypothetical protein